MTEIEQGTLSIFMRVADGLTSLIHSQSRALELAAEKLEALYARVEELEARQHVHAVGNTVTVRTDGPYVMDARPELNKANYVADASVSLTAPATIAGSPQRAPRPGEEWRSVTSPGPAWAIHHGDTA